MPKPLTSRYFWYFVARSNGLSFMRWKMSRPRPSRIFQPVSVVIERSWMAGGSTSSTSKTMPSTPALFLIWSRYSSCRWSLLGAVLVLDGDELERDLVGGILAACDPLDQLHEVPGLVEHPHVGVDDRDLRGTTQVRNEQRVVRDAALALLVLAVALEQLGSGSGSAAFSVLRHRLDRAPPPSGSASVGASSGSRPPPCAPRW